MLKYIYKIAFFTLTLLTCVSFFSLFSCTKSGAWATKVQWKDFELSDLPNQADYPEEGAIVLLDDGKMEVFGDIGIGFSSFERHKVIKIFNIRGHRFANVMIPYFPNVDVENIQARTIGPDGKIIVLSKKDIYDVNLYPNFVFYSDQRAKIFTMPAVENGSIIEYKYKVTISNRTLWHSWVFQEDIPSLLSRFILVYPAEWKLNYRLYNLDLQPEVIQAPDGFKASYFWEQRNMPGITSEFGMPHRKELLARLSFAPVGVKTWQDVSTWYHELSSPKIEADEDIKMLAQELTGTARSDDEKLKNIYEWVRDNVRYIAVEIGIGGFQPYPAEEVLDNQYGDCKDMTTLICSLAREADIEVNEVLISTRQNGIADTSLPSPFHFNHAIAYCPTVGEGGMWLDATEKGCPYGELPWYDQNVPVLVVGKNGAASLKITPGLPADSNRVLIDWIIDLHSNDLTDIEGKTSYWGALAAEMREDLYFSSKSDIEQWLEIYLAKRCSGAKLRSFQVNGLHPVKDPLEISYSFYTESFTTNRSGHLICRPGEINRFDLPDYFRSDNRRYPIHFRFGSRYDLKLSFRLGSGLQIITQIYQDSLESHFGQGFWSLAHHGNEVQVRSKHTIYGEKIIPEKYSDFQIFLDKMRTNNLREVVFSRSNLTNK